MAKFSRTFVLDNMEMTVTADSYGELMAITQQMATVGWTPEKNNWAGLVMATPSASPKPVAGECRHHPGKMRPDTDGKGGKYCHAKLDDNKWCGYSTKADGSVKKQSRLDLPVQSAMVTPADEFDF